MVKPQVLNRLATMAILPLLGAAFWIALRAQEGPAPDLSAEGVLVVAGLRDRTITFRDFSSAAPPAPIPLPGSPHELVFLDGSIYITLGRGNALAVVGAASRQVTRTFPLAGEPHGIAAAGGSVWVTLDSADEVVRFTAPGLTEAGRAPTGDTPHAIVTTGGSIVVTDSREDRIHQLLPVEMTVPTGETPESIAIVGGYLATADAGSGTVSIFERKTLAHVGSVETGGRPVRVVAFDESTLLVALGGKGELAVLDLEQLTVVSRVPVGALPDGICVSPSGRYVAVAVNGDDALAILDSRGWQVVATVPSPGGPGACLWLSQV